MTKYNIEQLHTLVKEPGIYFDMSNEDYHNDKSLSNSGMSNIMQTPNFGNTIATPRRFWWSSAFNEERQPIESEALKMGQAIHTLLLEPELFHEQFTIKTGAKKSGLPNTLGEEQYKQVLGSVNAIRNEEFLSKIFENAKAEVSLFWIDEQTGVPCRVRFDSLGLLFSADLKTVSDVYNLAYSIIDYGYVRQAAFYMHGLQQIQAMLREGSAVVSGCNDKKWLDSFIGNDQYQMPFVFQEKKAPFVTRSMVFDNECLSIGMEQASFAMSIFKENYERFGPNQWHSGFENHVETITLDQLPQRFQY